MLDVFLVDSARDIDAGAWEALCSTTISGALYSSPEWCDVASRSDGVAQRYLVAREGDTLLGVVPVDLVATGGPARYDLERLLASPYDVSLPAWRPERTLLPGLAATTRAGNSCDVRLHPALAGAARTAVLRALLDGLAEAAERQCAASAAFLYAPPGLASVPTDVAYGCAYIGGNVLIRLDFPDLAAHVHRLRAARRHSIRHDLAGLRAAGGEIRVSPLGDRLDLHARHASLNARKYGHRLDVAEYRERLALIARKFGGDALVAVLHAGRSPVASCHFVRYRNVLHARASGSEPETDPRLAPFYNTAVYEGIRLGLALGCSHLVTGRELPDRKMSRGFEIEPDVLLVANPDAHVRRRLAEASTAVRARLQELRALRLRGYRPEESIRGGARDAT